MCDFKYPKILIVGRVAWTKDESTLSGIFNGYPADMLAYICIETRQPDISRCGKHFQISETAMIRRLFKWSTKTGNTITSVDFGIDKINERQEQAILNCIRSHRSIFYLYLRELLWLMGGWKTKTLKTFILEFQPDVVFCVGDPLPLMNKLQRYVLKKANVPGAIFMMDDIFSYKTSHTLSQKIYRWLLRRQVRSLMGVCDAHFAISPKMQRECDSLFGIHSVLLTKGIEIVAKPLDKIHQPIKLVYTGNLLYGRMSTLAVVARTISSFNASGHTKALLNIYTQTKLSKEQRDLLEIEGVSQLHAPVAYNDLPKIYEQSDIVLFVESLEEKNKYVARLSFSTKLTDYLASGRCIFAVGAADTAPMEYLQEAKIAVTCGNENEIEDNLLQLLTHPNTIIELAERSLNYGKEHHNSQLMHKRLLETIRSIV